MKRPLSSITHHLHRRQGQGTACVDSLLENKESLLDPMGSHLYWTYWITVFQIALEYSETGVDWNSNLHLSLTSEVSKVLNRTNCWICMHMPEHSGKPFSLIGVPIRGNESWREY